MDKTMENENEEALNGELNSENGFEPEDIPLWLQGIEEESDEDITPTRNENDAPDQWINEIPEEDHEETEVVNDPDEVLQNGEGLPDWIEKSQEEPSITQDNLDSVSNQEEEAIEFGSESEENSPNESILPGSDINLELNTGDYAEEIPNSGEVDSHDEDFVEISEAEITDDIQMNQSNKSSDNEDLPYWLQEMIAEPSENEIDDQEPDSADSRESLDVESESDLFFSEKPEEHLPSQESMNDLDESQLDEAEASAQIFTELEAEDTTKPVIIQNENQITPEIPVMEDVEENDLDLPEEMPEILSSAKMLLEEGKYSQAIEAINTNQENSQYKDEIRTWLLSAVETDDSGKSDIWEALGDLALSEENPEEALDAYTKAINALMTGKKEIDEID